MQWTYTLSDRSSLGMGMQNSRELEDQRQLSLYGRYSLTQDWALSAESLSRDPSGPAAPAGLPHRRAAPLLGFRSPVRRYTAARMRLALFDLDNTLLAGDSDYEWGQFLIDRGVLEREAYEAQNRAFTSSTRRGRSTSTSSSASPCARWPTIHRRTWRAGTATSCARASSR
jgi:hypothetical protein